MAESVDTKYELFSQDLINDIILLNNIYIEYKNQSDLSGIEYIKIYSKYQDNFNIYHLKCIDWANKLVNYNNTLITQLKIVGKFYKYNSNNKKINIPIFYDNNNLYTYNEFINIITNPNLLSFFTLSEDGLFYNNYNTSYYKISYSSPIYTLYQWYLLYENFKNIQIDELINNIHTDKILKLLHNIFEIQFIQFDLEIENQFTGNIPELHYKINNLEIYNKELIKENMQIKQNNKVYSIDSNIISTLKNYKKNIKLLSEHNNILLNKNKEYEIALNDIKYKNDKLKKNIENILNEINQKDKIIIELTQHISFLREMNDDIVDKLKYDNKNNRLIIKIMNKKLIEEVNIQNQSTFERISNNLINYISKKIYKIFL